MPIDRGVRGRRQGTGGRGTGGRGSSGRVPGGASSGVTASQLEKLYFGQLSAAAAMAADFGETFGEFDGISAAENPGLRRLFRRKERRRRRMASAGGLKKAPETVWAEVIPKVILVITVRMVLGSGVALAAAGDEDQEDLEHRTEYQNDVNEAAASAPRRRRGVGGMGAQSSAYSGGNEHHAAVPLMPAAGGGHEYHAAVPAMSAASVPLAPRPIPTYCAETTLRV